LRTTGIDYSLQIIGHHKIEMVKGDIYLSIFLKGMDTPRKTGKITWPAQSP
jgi:hypothetical protein